MSSTVIILIVAGVLITFAVSLYNKIVGLKEGVKNAKTQISIQLDRRGKIFDSLISSVKKAMDYEKTTLKEVIELRTKSINLKGDAFSNEEKKNIEEQISSRISSGAFASKFQMTMEAYPDLKANENLLQLQEEIVSTENRLSFAKQGYNDSIEEYNSTIQSVPELFIVKMFSGLKEHFEYWRLSEEKVAQEEERRVKF